MAASTKIEWTDNSWNPVTGCNKVSPGCRNCYAEHTAKRLLSMGNPRYRNGFQVTLHPDLLTVPYQWRTPRYIFVNSMSDLFHDQVPDDFIAAILDVIRNTPHHTYQALTKRSDRALQLADQGILPDPPIPNLWLGVSVENPKYAYRMDDLRQIPAYVRFVSAEPLLAPLPDLNLADIHWLIAGGETGPQARAANPDWFRDLRNQCQQAAVPFFFKQHSGFRPKAGKRLLDGREHNDRPERAAATLRAKPTKLPRAKAPPAYLFQTPQMQI